MALIQCPECGKNFSDKAPACPECGCPTECILKELESSKQLADDGYTEKYDIMGREFLLTRKMHMSLIWKIAMRNAHDNVEADALSFYHSMKTVDELIEKLPEHIALLMDTMLGTSVDLLVSMGIYDLDKEAFYHKYYLDNFDTEPIMSSLIERYVDILGYEEELRQYREYVKQAHRSRWSGGGFGITGAIKGSIKAQLMNIGNGFLHALPEHTQRVNDEYAVKQAKERMLKDPETYKSILAALQVVVDGIHHCAMRELVANGVVAEYHYDTAKADSLLNNYNNLDDNAKDSVEIKMLREAFFADPSYYRVYFAILSTEYDKSGSVQKLADKLGYGERLEKDYEEYERQYIEDLKESVEDELHELETTAVADNETLFRVLDQYFKLSREIDYMLEDEIMTAVTKRAGKGFTHSEVGAVKKYFHKYEHLLEEEFVENVLSLVKRGEQLKELGVGWKEKKEKWNSFTNKCRWSVMYLAEVFESALERDAVAQEFFFNFVFREIGKDAEKDKENLNRYFNFREFFSFYRDEETYNSFENTLLGLENILDGNRNAGIELLKANRGCTLANYILFMLFPKETEYLQRGAENGSLLAAEKLFYIIEKDNPREADQYAIKLGFANIREMESLLFCLKVWSYGEPYRNYDERGLNQEIYYYPTSYYAEDSDEFEDMDEPDLIKNVDAYCKEQYLYYENLLKDGSVRYLLNTGNYPMDSAELPFMKPGEKDVPLYDYVLWKICKDGMNNGVLLTSKGVLNTYKNRNQFVSYKDYVPDCMDLEDFFKDFGHRGLIESVIAVFRYAYIKHDGLDALFTESEVLEALNPFATTENDETEKVDVCVENEQFGEDIEQIFTLLKKNEFPTAFKQIVDIRNSHKGKYGNPKDDLETAIIAAILKTARHAVSNNWFEQYQMVAQTLANRRSDLVLENAINETLLCAKGYKKPDPIIVTIFRRAALAGRHDAIKIMIKLCQHKALGAENGWGDGWKEKLKIPDNKTNIFKLVERIWVDNGNPMPSPLDEILQPARRKAYEKPYYNYDEVNASHHWKILLAYSKVLPIHDEKSIQGIYKGASLYEGGNTLANQIRAFYGIPKEEIIFIMQDVSVVASKFKKGVIFTDKAIYFNNTSVDKIAWEDFSESKYSFGMLTYKLQGQKFEPPEIKNPDDKYSIPVMIHLLPHLAKNSSVAALDADVLIQNCPQVDVKKCFPDEHFMALLGKKLQPAEYEYSPKVEYILKEDNVDQASYNTAVKSTISEQSNEAGSSGKTDNKMRQQLQNPAKEQVQNVSAVSGKIEQAKTTKYCAFCGKQIERTAKFCNYCGEATEEVNRYAEKSKLVGYKFALSSKEIFSVTGRGVVVTGCISAGTVYVHDNVEVLHADGSSAFAVVSSIEKKGVKKTCDSATVGDNVGLLLSGVSRNQVECGDTIVKR